MLEVYLRAKKIELEERTKRFDISERELWACRYAIDQINAVFSDYNEYLEQVEIGKITQEIEEN